MSTLSGVPSDTCLNFSKLALVARVLPLLALYECVQFPRPWHYKSYLSNYYENENLIKRSCAAIVVCCPYTYAAPLKLNLCVFNF